MSLSELSHPTALKLCTSCAGLDFATIFGRLPSSVCVPLGAPESWQSSICDFCEFLTLSVKQQDFMAISTVAPRDMSMTLTPRGKFRMTLRDRFIRGAFGHADLDGRGSGAFLRASSSLEIKIICTPAELSSKLHLPPSMVDFNSVQGWLKMSAAGSENAPSHDTGWNFPWTRKHENLLWVIDCTNRCIVRLPTDAAYVTLSYVWGSTQSATSLSELHGTKSLPPRLPSSLPATVEDSIAVCGRLNHRYLWIDRYCIRQDDPMERHRNIQAMDTIYKESILTIVACAGSDADHGLPGVSSPRLQCASLFAKGIGYLQAIPTEQDIYKSVWAHRGWTLQEALLSQTRIYFTNTQVVFEDEHSVSCEWLWRVGTYKIATDKGSMLFSQKSTIAYPGGIYRCLEDFQKRQLSYASDRLSAMQGIFAVFNRKFEVRHLSGLPYMILPPKPPMLRWKNIFDLEFSLLRSLLFMQLEPHVRCTEFPSWTWAGWTGDTGMGNQKFNMETDQSRNGHPCKAVEIAVDRSITWEEYQAAYSHLHFEHGIQIRYIFIEAWMASVVDLPSQPNRLKLGSECEISLRLSNEVALTKDRMTHPWYGSEMNIYPDERCALLRFLVKQPRIWAEKSYAYMLIRNMGAYWERVWLFDQATYKDNEGLELGSESALFTLQTIRMG